MSHDCRILADIAEQTRHLVRWSSQERSWAAGYRAARALRAEITADPGERFTSTEVIAKKLGAVRTSQARSAIPGVLALIARNEEDVHMSICAVVSRTSGHLQAQNFAFARAIGDARVFP